MPGQHDSIVLVHGVGDGEVQGDFLVDVAEPLVRWVAANGGEDLLLEPMGLRRGPRPARLHVTGRIPDAMHPGQMRAFEWRLTEARWSDEFKPPPERRASAWSVRTLPQFVLDQLAYYDTMWRFWALFARLGGWAERIANAPAAQGDEQAWRYRYDIAGPFWRYKLPYALWFGLIAPVVILAVASVLLIPATPVWLISGRLDAWERSYYNALYRLIITAVWLPVVVLAFVLLVGVAALTLLPFPIARLETVRRFILTALRMRFADAYVFSNEWVDASAVEEAVGIVIAREIESDCRSLTVVAYSQGGVVAYEVLAALGRPAPQPASSTPYLSVTQAQAAISRPLPRTGMPVTLITVGAALNRTLGRRRRPMLEEALPPGTRWVDIWSGHDPVPMGTLDRGLVAESGLMPEEERVNNNLTPMNAHTTYWNNTHEVIATIAEEAVTVHARAATPPGAPTAPGLWAWRAAHGRADRACALSRRAWTLHVLAVLRATGYLAIMAAGPVQFMQYGGGIDERLIAGTVSAVIVAVVYLAVFVVLEWCVLAVARPWWDTPCVHTERG